MSPRRGLRLLPMLVSIFLLCGCWAGSRLYSARDAVSAIPPGVYLADEEDSPQSAYNISMLPNGLTRFDRGEKSETYGFAPLDAGQGTFVGWADMDDAPSTSPPGLQIYALLVKRSDRGFEVYLPDCGKEHAQAESDGAKFDDGVCTFPTRVALERALRHMPRTEPLRLVRAP